MEDSKLIIRPAQWGYGVFAWSNIQPGTIIGEYLGRLMPLDKAVPTHNNYIFTVPGHVEVDAGQYGNVGFQFSPPPPLYSPSGTGTLTQRPRVCRNYHRKPQALTRNCTDRSPAT